MSRFDERGAMGGLEGLAFGVLIFAFGTLMVLNAWAVVDGKLVASAAAREATRSFVEAPNERAAREAADSAAQQVVNGRRNARTTLDIAPIGTGAGFGRCEQITANVRIDVPRVSLPLIGGTGGTFPVSATHTEVIDPYRSGLESTATCS
jgi:Flp pilus assembly protein TadG